MRAIWLLGLLGVLATPGGCDAATPGRLADTGQIACYGLSGEVDAPAVGERFSGQDAQYGPNEMTYRDNGDGTVTDLVTALIWQQDPGVKMTFKQAKAGAAGFRLAGHGDWRLPTIKELYSLIDFRGYIGPRGGTPYINTDVFKFTYGDPALGERSIDSQFCSSTEYVGTTMGRNHTVFGVNFADGRIKGYPGSPPFPGAWEKTFYCLYVRGASGYGVNDFTDNGDETITDAATGLTWMKDDSGKFGVGDFGTGQVTWEQALAWAEGLTFAGRSDWRLPNAKELQSLVDYTRSPQTHGVAAIDPLFNCTEITREDGEIDFGFYWTSTTHLDGPTPGARACYVCFGSAMGYMQGRWMDVHGAGAQRSDLKAGDPRLFQFGHGPQGDAQRMHDFARCVRG